MVHQVYLRVWYGAPGVPQVVYGPGYTSGGVWPRVYLRVYGYAGIPQGVRICGYTAGGVWPGIPQVVYGRVYHRVYGAGYTTGCMEQGIPPGYIASLVHPGR